MALTYWPLHLVAESLVEDVTQKAPERTLTRGVVMAETTAEAVVATRVGTQAVAAPTPATPVINAASPKSVTEMVVTTTEAVDVHHCVGDEPIIRPLSGLPYGV